MGQGAGTNNSGKRSYEKTQRFATSKSGSKRVILYKSVLTNHAGSICVLHHYEATLLLVG